MSYPPWSDLDDDLLKPSLVPPMGTRKVSDAAPVAIMVSAAPDLNYITSGFGAFQSSTFLNSTLFTFGGDKKGICVAGPYVGAPYATMILESLIARGAEKVLVIGWCGSIHPDVKTGDVIVPEHAIVHEGTSVNYQLFDQIPWTTRPSDLFANDLLQWCRGFHADIKAGPVWTTDAIYRETAEKVAYFRNLGALVVEMECSALFSVAAYRQVDLAALLVVSDSLAASGKMPAWQPGFRSAAFKQARKKACDMVMTFAGDLLQHEQ
jgi:purine-nucleoside phosphorylase